MASSVRRIAVAASALLLPMVRGQLVQDDWLAPALPDYDTTIKIGDTYRIKWTKNLQGWFAQYAPTADVTNVDLWAHATESDDEITIENGINVNETQSVDWKVDISNDQLTNSAFWSFQFRASGATSSSEGEISSPIVVVRGAADSPTPTTTAGDNSETQTSGSTDTETSDATATTGTTDSEATATATGTAADSDSDSSSSPSSGATAGIVIGAVAVVLIGAGIFLWLKKKKKKTKHNRRPDDVLGAYPADAASPYMAQSDVSHSPAPLPPQELPANPNHHYELGPGR